MGMSISRPSLKEKEQAFENILVEGLSRPEGVWAFCTRMYRALGTKFIFFDHFQAIVMALAVVIGVIFLLSMNTNDYAYSTIYTLAPLFFVAIVSLTEWRERSNPLYELKMTFKHTIQDLIVFRTLCYSIVSITLCLLLSVGVADKLDFLRAASITLSALFLCALLTVAITRRFNGRWMYLTGLVVWMAMVFIPSWLVGNRWELFLARIPVVIMLVIGIGVLLLYLKEIKQYLNMSQREVGYDVGR